MAVWLTIACTFGNPAVFVILRPVALRPLITQGLPLSDIYVTPYTIPYGCYFVKREGGYNY